MNRTYLFAYGTLRKDLEPKAKAEVKDDLVFIGIGKIEAALYDLGDYPGAVKATDGCEVEGDVFRVLNAEKVFRILDEYEGEEYGRELERVKINTGEELSAWVYWYIEDRKGKTRIEDNSYLDYLKTKDSLR